MNSQLAQVLDPQLSYAQGVHVAQLIEDKIQWQRDLGITINKEEFIQGFSDQILAKTALSRAKITELNRQLYHLMQVRNLEKNANVGLANFDAGQVFLAKNKQKNTVQQTSSGLQFEVIKKTQGAKPQAHDVVTLHYSAQHLDGRHISSSFDTQKPLTIAVNQLFNGFEEGVKLMSAGSSYQFYIPSKLAYGIAGDVNLHIGPNEVLIYKVDLINIKPQHHHD